MKFRGLAESYKHRIRDRSVDGLGSEATDFDQFVAVGLRELNAVAPQMDP